MNRIEQIRCELHCLSPLTTVQSNGDHHKQSVSFNGIADAQYATAGDKGGHRPPAQQIHPQDRQNALSGVVTAQDVLRQAETAHTDRQYTQNLSDPLGKPVTVQPGKKGIRCPQGQKTCQQGEKDIVAGEFQYRAVECQIEGDL